MFPKPFIKVITEVHLSPDNFGLHILNICSAKMKEFLLKVEQLKLSSESM